MTLRPATPSDVPALASLERTLFGVDAWSEAAVMSEVDGALRHCLVAFEDDEVVGYVVLLSAGDVVDLQRIGVRPDRQRRGTARSLLGAALDHAREAGAHRMLLEVSAANEAALAFYAAAGFTEIHRRRHYYRDGSDAVVMRRPIHGVDDGRG